MILIAQAAQAAPIIAKWFEGSVVVGVIIALLSGFWYFGKLVVEKIETIIVTQKETVDEITTKHEASLTQVREIHREERKEWREISNEREKQVTDVCGKVIETLHEFKNGSN